MAELAYVRTPEFMTKLFKGYATMHISEKIERLMFFYFSCLMVSGAILWGVICVVQGNYLPSLIPFSFVVATLINFTMIGQSADNKLGFALQVFVSISMPFVFQFALGGIVNSGFIMLWSILALLGSMTFLNNKEILAWAVLFVALCIHSFFFEATVFSKTARSLPVVSTAINLLLVSTIIFGLAHYFVRMQERLQQTFALKKQELQLAREGIDNDLRMAKEFQDLLQSNVHVSDAFKSKISFSRNKSHVNGNFHWQGDFLNNHVVVFVENPHKGIQGSMEAMMLWNLIENSVSRAEVRAPHNLIEFVQRDLYSKYNIPQIRESFKDVKMTVLCHDDIKNEIAYACLGSTLLINEGEHVKVLCGFDKSNGESIIAPNGVQINIGQLMPQSSAKLLFVNHSMLETLGIKDDMELSKFDNQLNALFAWDFEIAEIELQKQIDKLDYDNDLFLLGLQL
jgi:hypothetical protein